MKLPIAMKYFTVDVGVNIQTKQDDVSVALYVVTNNATNIVEFEGLVLAEVLEKSMAMDRNMHRAFDYFGKSLDDQKWLDGCLPDDEDEGRIAVPEYLARNGGEGGAPPVH